MPTGLNPPRPIRSRARPEPGYCAGPTSVSIGEKNPDRRTIRETEELRSKRPHRTDAIPARVDFCRIRRACGPSRFRSTQCGQTLVSGDRIFTGGRVRNRSAISRRRVSAALRGCASITVFHERTDSRSVRVCRFSCTSRFASPSSALQRIAMK